MDGAGSIAVQCQGVESDCEPDNDEERFLLDYTYLIPLTPQMLLVALQWETERAGEPSFCDVLRFVSDNFCDILYPSILEDEVRTKLDVLASLGVVRLVRGAYQLLASYIRPGRLGDDVIARFWQLHAFRQTRLVSKNTQTEGTRGLRKRVRPDVNLMEVDPKVPRREGNGDCDGDGDKKWETYIG